MSSSNEQTEDGNSGRQRRRKPSSRRRHHSEDNDETPQPKRPLPTVSQVEKNERPRREHVDRGDRATAGQTTSSRSGTTKARRKKKKSSHRDSQPEKHDEQKRRSERRRRENGSKSESRDNSKSERRRRENGSKSESSRDKSKSSHHSAPRPRTSRVDEDERIKRKMREADNIATTALTAGNAAIVPSQHSRNKSSSATVIEKDEEIKRRMAQELQDSLLLSSKNPRANNKSFQGVTSVSRPGMSQAEKDERLKRKMAEADGITSAALGVGRANSSTRTSSMLDRDEKLKRKMAQANQLTSALFLNERVDDESLKSSDPSISCVSRSEAGFIPLEPSTQRVSKQRDPNEHVIMTPGAYAMTGFSVSNSNFSAEDELFVFEDADDYEDELLVMTGDVSDLKLKKDSARKMKTGSSAGASSSRSMDEEKGGGGSHSGGNEGEVLEADVAVATDSYQKGKDDAAREYLTSKQKARRRTLFRAIVVLCLVVLIFLAAYMIVTRDDGDKDEPNEKEVFTEAPTPSPPSASPTSSPAPTVATVPFTVVISFDRNPQEIGWTLECGGGIVKDVPFDSYYGGEGDTVYETLYLKEKTQCLFTIYDKFGNGICCDSGEGFYKLYLAEEEDIPDGFVAEGGEFGNFDNVRFRAV